ncbi:MAG: DUF4388 domain-containing protein [Caldithrix sp.]|nr:DUF4388 domain-containing protein [Caldithrix sp.]
MKHFALIGEREKDFYIFYNHFNHNDIHYSWINSADNITKVIVDEKPDIAFVIGDDLEQMLQWVQAIKDAYYKIPFVCFIPHFEWKKRETLWQAGASELVQLPVMKKELEHILNTFIPLKTEPYKNDPSIVGSLEDFRLLDLIQAFEEADKTCVIELEKNVQKGKIYIKNGRIIDAVHQSKDPLEAIKILSTWITGTFKVSELTEYHKQRLHLDNQQILLECLNTINDLQKIRKELPAPNRLYYASPVIDYEELGPSDRQAVLKFKKGLSINDFLEIVPDNPVKMIQKIIKWLKQEIIVNEARFEQLTEKLEREQAQSGFVKMVNRLLGKRGQEFAVSQQSSGNEENDQKIERLEIKDAMFLDKQRLERFKNFLETR